MRSVNWGLAGCFNFVLLSQGCASLKCSSAKLSPSLINRKFSVVYFIQSYHQVIIYERLYLSFFLTTTRLTEDMFSTRIYNDAGGPDTHF